MKSFSWRTRVIGGACAYLILSSVLNALLGFATFIEVVDGVLTLAAAGALLTMVGVALAGRVMAPPPLRGGLAAILAFAWLLVSAVLLLTLGAPVNHSTISLAVVISTLPVLLTHPGRDAPVAASSVPSWLITIGAIAGIATITGGAAWALGVTAPSAPFSTISFSTQPTHLSPGSTLPLFVDVSAPGDSTVELTTTLDGNPVGTTTPATAGQVVLDMPVPATLGCGHHRVSVEADSGAELTVYLQANACP